MSRLISALDRKMGLPSEVTYRIQHKESGKTLEDDDTLNSAGFKNGDKMRLVADLTVGLTNFE